MGLEARCVGRYGSQVSEGKAHLDSDHLLFRGDFRLMIPFNNMKAVKADDGCLTIALADGSARFELGPAARKWADKILHPPQRLDKLGVKPELRVVILGVQDPTFHAELEARTAVIFTVPQHEADLIFLGAEVKSDLKKLPSCMERLKHIGAVWVIYPKGVTQITQADVMSASKAAGFVDVKVVSFSVTHTALKLLITVANRKKRGKS